MQINGPLAPEKVAAPFTVNEPAKIFAPGCGGGTSSSRASVPFLAGALTRTAGFADGTLSVKPPTVSVDCVCANTRPLMITVSAINMPIIMNVNLID